MARASSATPREAAASRTRWRVYNQALPSKKHTVSKQEFLVIWLWKYLKIPHSLSLTQLTTIHNLISEPCVPQCGCQRAPPYPEHLTLNASARDSAHTTKKAAIIFIQNVLDIYLGILATHTHKNKLATILISRKEYKISPIYLSKHNL